MGERRVETLARQSEEVYTVSRLTQEIKGVLEGGFPSLWVEGEISNFRAPSSGHFYFTLKDPAAQIRVVMFRSRILGLRFAPEDGMQVVCRAGLSVYPPRGDYQLVAEWLEPRGQGTLQLALEALKRRLAAEGLFDPARKKSLPFLPREVGVVTSAAGAAVRDILQILWRRFPNLAVRLCPVRVQGDAAKEEIVEALRMLNEEGRAEVIILGRGGGSLEDLWAFNEEVVARAIAASVIPVVSAVGHEIDFTIADLVADLRAPTPSAAAELVVPEKAPLVEETLSLKNRLRAAVVRETGRRRQILFHLSKRIVHPGRRIEEGCVRLDDLSERLSGAVTRRLGGLRSRLEELRGALGRANPGRRIEFWTARLDSVRRELARLGRHRLEIHRRQCQGYAGRLESLSPLGVLARGYSLTRLIPSGSILRSVEGVCRGDRVEVTLAQGELACVVEAVRGGGVFHG